MRHVALLLALAPGAARAQAGHHLLPVPPSLELRPGRLRLDSTFTFAIVGRADGRLRRALDRALRRLEGRTGLTLSRAPAADTARAALVVRARGAGMAVQGVEEDESYALTVDERRALLDAPTVVGVLRGLETLLQLVEADSAGGFVPAVAIADRPRFPWRGLLVDVSRHFQPVPVIERNLDAMAAVKLNVFHWHLADDQGFRVASRRYPRLQRDGSDGLYYTQDEIRAVVAYARDRGIRVVPEFDMPAHATSWFVGYPQYAAAPGPYEIERTFGVHDAVFDPTREAVYGFIDRFVGEMAALFPDAYFHIGGDEANGTQWHANARIQAFMRAHGLRDDATLQAYFNRRLLAILRRHGKRMVGWDEILHPDLPRSVVVQSWRGQESLGAGARAGYRGILSAGYYLDAMRPAEDHYRVDPLPDSSGLSEAEAGRILGGEVCMWGEIVTPETIDSRIWPRTAAVAERLWSPRAVADVDDLYRRLAVVSTRLEELGLTHELHADRMLRRIAPGMELGPLQVLVTAVEPVSLAGRMGVDPATQLTPLTALSDAARPDPPSRRRIARWVEGFLANGAQRAAYRDSLARTFNAWQAAGPAVAALAEGAPLARPGVPLALDLAELGAAGLEALNGVAGDHAALVERMSQPRAHLRFTVLDPLRRLLAAAAPVPPE